MTTQTYEPLMTEQEIMDAAAATVDRYRKSGCNPDDVEEARCAFILGAWEATTRADADKAGRSLQWQYAYGSVKKYWAKRFRHVAPASRLRSERKGLVSEVMSEAETYADDYLAHNTHKDMSGDDRDAAVVSSLDGDGETSLLEVTPSNAQAPVEIVGESEERQALYRAMSILPEHLAEVIRGRFFEDKTLSEIAEGRGVSCEAIRQQEERALEILRKAMK